MRAVELTVKLTPELWERLRERANRKQIGPAEVVIEILDKHLTGYKQPDLEKMLYQLFMAGATNLEALRYVNARRPRKVAYSTIGHYRWRIRRLNPEVPSGRDAEHLEFNPPGR